MNIINHIKPIRHFLTIVVMLICFLVFPLTVKTQSHNHWTRSFNEESSLLSGAVVGGGAGPAAIFYNPSSIAEINESKFSLHASLFSLNMYNVKNALGDGIDLNYMKAIIEPRFISYMIQPKKHPEWSFEIAFLNNENYHLEFTKSVDENINILSDIPGNERYFALSQYSNSYRDDWIGFGGSWKVNTHLYAGASMFVSMKSMNYYYSLDIEAMPSDSLNHGKDFLSFYSASYNEMDFVKYNDYRLLWKFGLLYKKDRFSFGLNITTPSLGGIYSDGKKVSKKVKQSNISDPETGQMLPDFVIVDYQEKKEVDVNSKSALSIAAGFTYFNNDKSKVLYTTIEYFNSIDPFRLVEANDNPSILYGSPFEKLDYKEWLTFIEGAKPILNAAIAYRWTIKQDLMLLSGFRTDFNYRKNINPSPFAERKLIKGLNVDLYHITSGLSWRIKGQDLMTGLQYSIGRLRNQQQFRNLSDPVEYNTIENTPLQGTITNTMNTFFNSLSFYFGATFNFGGENSK